MIVIKFHAPEKWTDCFDLAAGFDLRWGLCSVGISVFGLGFNADFTWGG